MREYGQVQCAYWQAPETQRLSAHGKLLALYLITGPHSNGIGCYWLPDGYVMADLGWDQETVSKGFAELFREGFANRFESVVFIPKFLYWNPISNPNVAKARRLDFDALPKGEAKLHAARALLRFGAHLGNPFETVCQTVCQTSSKQNPTQPNPTQPNPLGSSTLVEFAGATPTDLAAKPEKQGEIAQRIFVHWRDTHRHPRAKLDAKRKKTLSAALALGYSEADLCQAITGYQHSPYHSGENDTGTVYDDLELMLRDSKHIDQGLKFYAEPPRRDLSKLTRRNVAATQDWQPPEMRKGNAKQ